MRHLVVVLALAAVLGGCAKGKRAAVEDWALPNDGGRTAPACHPPIGVEQLRFEGYLQLARDTVIIGDEANLLLYATIDAAGRGQGRPALINVSLSGTDEALSAGPPTNRMGMKGPTLRSDKLSTDVLRIPGKNGVATSKDRVRLLVRPFLSEEHYEPACVLEFVEAEKL